MEPYNNCQCCGMPLDRTFLLGTEEDGSRSMTYCIHCYKDGAFTDPGMTMEQMQQRSRNILTKAGADEKTILTAVQQIPFLGRWNPHIRHFHCSNWNGEK